MAIDLKKTEYNYLLKLYLVLAEFDPMTSTFTFLEEMERKEINLTISVLQKKLMEIMPRVQDRESYATNQVNDKGRVTGTRREEESLHERGNRRDSTPVKGSPENIS